MKKLLLVAAAFITMSAAVLTSCQQAVTPVIPELNQEQHQQNQESNKTDTQTTTTTTATPAVTQNDPNAPNNNSVSEFTLSFDSSKFWIYINGGWVCPNGTKVKAGDEICIDLKVSQGIITEGYTLDKIIISGKEYEGPRFTIDSINASYAKDSTIEISYTEKIAENLVSYTFDSSKMSCKVGGNSLLSGSSVREGQIISFYTTLPVDKVIDKWIIAGKEYPSNALVDDAKGIIQGYKRADIFVKTDFGTSVSVDYTVRDAKIVTIKYGDNITCYNNSWSNDVNSIVASNSTVYEGNGFLRFVPTIPEGKTVDKWIVNSKEEITYSENYYWWGSAKNEIFSLEVSFRDLQTYIVEFSEGISCTVDNVPVTSGSTVIEGKWLTFLSTSVHNPRWKVNGFVKSDNRFSGKEVNILADYSNICGNKIKVEVFFVTYTLSFGSGITCKKWVDGNSLDVATNTEVYEGDVLSFTYTPAAGKITDKWKFNGVEKINKNGNKNNFIIYSLTSEYASNGKVAVEVVARDSASYTLQLGTGLSCYKDNGTNVPSGSTVQEGEQLYIYYIETGKVVDKWMFNGVEKTNNNSAKNHYNITVGPDYASDGKVAVEVTPRDAASYTLTLASGLSCYKDNGTNVPSGSTVQEGELFSIYYIETGKVADKWMFNGTEKRKDNNTYSLNLNQFYADSDYASGANISISVTSRTAKQYKFTFDSGITVKRYDAKNTELETVTSGTTVVYEGEKIELSATGSVNKWIFNGTVSNYSNSNNAWFPICEQLFPSQNVTITHN